MKEFFAVCCVTFIAEYVEEYKEETDYIILTDIDTYSDAVSKLEEYYGDDLISLTITLFEGPVFRMPKEIYDSILKNGGEIKV
jgi:hypothetical protein